MSDAVPAKRLWHANRKSLPQAELMGTRFRDNDRFDRIAAPSEDHSMLKFYYSGAPNPMKVALFLEEAGIPYEAIPVDTRKGDQHKPDFLRSIRTPRCRRSSTATPPCSIPARSCSISPRRPASSCRRKTDKARGELLSWMFFVSSGVGPYSGQSVHFRNYAPEKLHTRSTATSSRRSAISASSMRGSPSRNTCSATPTRSST